MWKILYLESCCCENGKYVASIMHNPDMMCDKIIES